MISIATADIDIGNVVTGAAETDQAQSPEYRKAMDEVIMLIKEHMKDSTDTDPSIDTTSTTSSENAKKFLHEVYNFHSLTIDTEIFYIFFLFFPYIQAAHFIYSPEGRQSEANFYHSKTDCWIVEMVSFIGKSGTLLSNGYHVSKFNGYFLWI